LIGWSRGNGDDLVFNIPPMICNLINPRIFYLKKKMFDRGSDRPLLHETVSMFVIDGEKKVGAGQLSALGMELLRGPSGVEIHLPDSTSWQSLQICLHHAMVDQYSGMVKLLEKTTNIAPKLKVHEFMIEYECYYLVEVPGQGKASAIGVPPGIALTVHELDMKSKQFKRWTFMDSVPANSGTSGEKNKISEWRGSRSTFVIRCIRSTGATALREIAVAILFQSEEESEKCGWVKLGTPVSDRTALKIALSEDSASALLQPKANLSALEITHLASTADIDYPIFHQIVQEAAKEGKFLLVSPHFEESS
jgi:hypothetical protein